MQHIFPIIAKPQSGKYYRSFTFSEMIDQSSGNSFWIVEIPV